MADALLGYLAGDTSWKRRERLPFEAGGSGETSGGGFLRSTDNQASSASERLALPMGSEDRMISITEACEPKRVPTCVLNPLKPLGVGFQCFMLFLKNIKRMKP